MYGITPKPNIENCFSAPPPITFINSRNPKLTVTSAVPGTWTPVPITNIINAPKVKSILNLKSLLVGANNCFIVWNILDHLNFASRFF